MHSTVPDKGCYNISLDPDKAKILYLTFQESYPLVKLALGETVSQTYSNVATANGSHESPTQKLLEQLISTQGLAWKAFSKR
jgi:hypothetical protein